MVTSLSVVVIFIVSALILLTCLLLLRIFYSELLMLTKRKKAEFIVWWHKINRKYGVLIDIFKKIKGNELSYSIDIIFQLFIHFYDKNKNEMEQWAFDKFWFPNGRKEISDLYHWITKIRIDNYLESHNLIHFDENILYWGTLYKSFKFRINIKGEIIINPCDDIEKFHFERSMHKLQNVLYNLDTEKCNWIIERRKFFGF